MTTTPMQARAEIVQERTTRGGAGGAGSPVDAVERLERFAQTALAQTPPPQRFELLQYIAGEGHSRVSSIPAEGAKPENVAHTAYELARYDAQGFAGVTSYWLVVYARGAESYSERCTFRVASRMLDSVAPSESATTAGLQLQSMRHIEVMAYQHAEGIRTVLREKDLTIDDLRRTCDKLLAERALLVDSQMQVVRMREELADESSTRRLTVDRERAAMASKQKVQDAFFSFVMPILAKRFAPVAELVAASSPSPAPAAVAEAPPPVAKSKAKAEAPAATSPPPTMVAKEAPRLSAETCARVVNFVWSLDQQTFDRMLGILDEAQGAKLMALVARLTAEADTMKPEEATP